MQAVDLLLAKTNIWGIFLKIESENSEEISK
jgi:hypothetical protein